jgi:hypothetical protein
MVSHLESALAEQQAVLVQHERMMPFWRVRHLDRALTVACRGGIRKDQSTGEVEFLDLAGAKVWMISSEVPH